MPPLYKTNITTITTAVTAAVVAADFKEKTQYRNAEYETEKDNLA